MGLATPQSAILSAVIFNALIIIALIPLALRGVALPGRAGERAAPAQPAHLWPRRDHRPLHRDQGDRPHRVRPPPRLGTRSMTRSSSPALAGHRAPHRPDRHHRRRLPGRRHRRRPGRLPVPGERLDASSRRRPDRRLEPHRAGLQRADSTSGAAPRRPAQDGYDASGSAGSNLGPDRTRSSSTGHRRASSGCGPRTATRRSRSTW